MKSTFIFDLLGGSKNCTPVQQKRPAVAGRFELNYAKLNRTSFAYQLKTNVPTGSTVVGLPVVSQVLFELHFRPIWV